LSVEQAETDG